MGVIGIIRTGVVLAAVLAIFAAAAWAQVGQEMREARTPQGITVYGPAAGQFFQMQIAGDGAERLRTRKKYWYRADGVKFEFFSEENFHFTPTDAPSPFGERVLLEMYRSAFLARFEGEKPKLKSSWVKLAGGKTALTWSYDKPVATPDGKNRAEREMFLVVSGPAQVFGLFAPVPEGQSESSVKKVLIRTLGSLEFRDTPLEGESN